MQAELQGKVLLAEKLQELARSLQAQNKQVKEEDLLKRQNMLADFQSAVDDIKTRCTNHSECFALHGSTFVNQCLVCEAATGVCSGGILEATAVKRASPQGLVDR